MKKLIFCLSLIFFFTASAESPILIEPILLEALFAQSGSLKAYESDGSYDYKLSELLGQTLGYNYNDTVISISHTCEYIDIGYNCILNIDSTTTVNGTVEDESDMIIRYSAEFEGDSSKVKISNVKVDFAG